jgi:hypothetical protein
MLFSDAIRKVISRNARKGSTSMFALCELWPMPTTPTSTHTPMEYANVNGNASLLSAILFCNRFFNT